MGKTGKEGRGEGERKKISKRKCKKEVGPWDKKKRQQKRDTNGET